MKEPTDTALAKAVRTEHRGCLIIIISIVVAILTAIGKIGSSIWLWGIIIIVFLIGVYYFGKGSVREEELYDDENLKGVH